MRNFESIDQTFRETVGRHPAKLALICKEKSFTFEELDESINKLAKALYNQGVRQQAKAVVYLPHMPEWIIVWLALQRIGCVAVPVSHFYAHDYVHYIAKDSTAEIAFCSQSNLDRVTAAAPDTGLKTIVIADMVELTDSERSQANEQFEIKALGSLLHDSDHVLPAIKIEARDLAEILYTSGTTGMPKGVPLCNAILLEQMYEAQDKSELLVPIGEGIALQGAPLNHILGQELGIGSLMFGNTLVLLPNMNLDELLSHIDKFQVTTFFGTPTLFRMILNHENLEQYKLNSLRYIFTGGETLPTEVAKRWFEKFGQQIYNGYGSTETSGGIAGAKAGQPFPEGSSGTIVASKRFMLVNPETLEPITGDEQGELLIGSEFMPHGYWNSPEETAKRFITLQGQLWYRTGDIVQITTDGWVFFKERSVDIIKHKGYRVAPSKIESVLYKHNAVGSCCVIGVPDESVGEKIKAFVILKADQGAKEEELIEWCRQSLVSYEVPHYIDFCQTLPLSPSGKILRKELRQQELLKREAKS
jgi:long-chain acyl-CoA synthetase